MADAPMHDRPELSELIKKSIAAFNAMSPEEQEAHLKAQRESWVRGEMALGEWERGMTQFMRPDPTAAPCCDCRERAERYRVALCRIARAGDKYSRRTADDALHIAERAAGGGP